MSTASLLDRRIGVDAVVVSVGGHVLPAGLTGAYRITQGRTDPDGQPVPGVCVLQLRTDALAQLPRAGDELRVELGEDALAWAGLDTVEELAAGRVRFVGHITDQVARPGLRPDDPGVLQLTATTPRARLGRTYVGDTPWPVELDGARAARILELAAVDAGLTLGDHDPGTVEVLARDVDRQPAARLLDDLAADTGGTLVELRDGTLVWHDAEHRQGVASSVELTAANVLRESAEAAQKLGGTVNDVELGYGPLVGGQQLDSVRWTDSASRDRFGPFSTPPRTTQLLDEADADALAYRIVGTSSVPRWNQPGLAVELLSGGGTVDAAQRRKLLQLQQGDLLTVAGFPAAGPFRRARLWAEGWTEEVSRTHWRLSIVGSDYGRGGPAPRWADVASDLTWADVDPDVTWWAAVGWDFGEDDPGRWLDRPGRQTWDQLDPALTWADLA